MSSDPRDAGATGIVYDIQGFSVQDGPGIRTTVFLKGCPLSCPWCHSPESQRFDIQLSWQWRKCIGMEQCGLCLDVCPHDAIAPGETVASTDSAAPTAAEPGHAPAAQVPAATAAGSTPVAESARRLIRVDWDRCDDCGQCAERCPAGALSMWGKSYTVSEVVSRVLRDRPFFERSGGGVTVSGGEPLAQPAFTSALLAALKAEGIHTALDTTGFASWTVVESVLPHVDLFLLDLKHMDSRAHKTVVGVPNEPILENARRIAAARRQDPDQNPRRPPVQRFGGRSPCRGKVRGGARRSRHHRAVASLSRHGGAQVGAHQARGPHPGGDRPIGEEDRRSESDSGRI